jgi:Ca-activated chloride channel family protein
MNSRYVFRLALIALTVVLLSVPAIPTSGAQDPPQPPQPKPAPQPKDQKDKKGAQRQGAQADEQVLGEDRIKIETDLVNLDVTVTDQNHTPVFDLTPNDFTVYEDKVKQTVENVSREEVPISFGLVIDTSGSMRSKLQIVTDSALSLVKVMRQDDEAFVASFKAEPELVQDFTADKRELEDALGELYTSGGTALLDAIIATADYAQEKGKRRRKALVIISDGLEKNSSVKEKEVMEAIKEDEVQVYLVGFIDEDTEDKSFFGRSPGKKAKELLTRIADDSGGRAYFPKDISEIPAIAAQIAKDLRTQYVLSYYPTNDKRDGTFRAVTVAVNQKGGRKLIARTRRGYYARNPQGQLPTAAQKKARSQ